MDAVLGLSVTPTTVGLVLVEGQDADGATMDRDAFEVPSRGTNAAETSEQAAAAVLRTEAAAATRGHRLSSIGVTWSDDANAEASLLLKSLTESGFDNVVPVRLPEATEALARGIADVIGYETTAVCVVEPDTVIALIVHIDDGAVQTAISHTIDSDERLVRWLSGVFTRADWRPEALVVVGSAGDLDAIMPRLEDALSVPVFAPVEAELALARGAALASAHGAELGVLDSDADYDDVDRRPGRAWSHVGPLALLAGGAVTFVVSVSLAIGLQLSGRSEPAESQPPPANTADTSESPAAVRPVAPVVPPPVVIPPPAPVEPPPSEAPVEIEPPVADVPVEMVPVVDAPAVVEESPPASVPPGAVPPAPQGPPVVEQVPTKKPPLLTRILGRLPGLHGGADEVEQPAQVAPPPPPPPEPAPPPPPPVP